MAACPSPTSAIDLCGLRRRAPASSAVDIWQGFPAGRSGTTECDDRPVRLSRTEWVLDIPATRAFYDTLGLTIDPGQLPRARTLAALRDVGMPLESPLRTGEETPSLSDERLARELLGTLDRTDFGHLGVRHEGKVRDSYVDGDVRTIVTSDRLSAVDRLLGTIPSQALRKSGDAAWQGTHRHAASIDRVPT